MPDPAIAERGISRASCSGKLSRIFELKIHWETVPQRIKWRTIKEDTWHQFLASSHTCTYIHVPTHMQIYVFLCTHHKNMSVYTKNIFVYKQKKLSMSTFGNLNTMKGEGITSFFCNQTSGILTHLLYWERKR